MSEFINTIDVLGDDVVIDSIIDRSITEFKDDTITSVGAYAFSGCTELATFDAPNVTQIAARAFNECTALETVNLPNVTSLGGRCFQNCTNLAMLEFPNITTIASYTEAIGPCGGGKTYLKMPRVTRLPTYAFRDFSPFVADFSSAVTFGNTAFGIATGQYLVLRSDTMCVMSGSNIFSGGISNYIFVPRALVEDYKVATNWSTYADQFRALEDYTVDGTVTGELDETKI